MSFSTKYSYSNEQMADVVFTRKAMRSQCTCSADVRSKRQQRILSVSASGSALPPSRDAAGFDAGGRRGSKNGEDIMLCPQCTVVKAELDAFEATLDQQTGKGKQRQPLKMRSRAGNSVVRASVAAGQAGIRPQGDATGKKPVRENMQLCGAPYPLMTAAGERASLLASSLRLQEAAQWLAKCPQHTLRVLQQRALCASEDYFLTFAGIPAYLRPLKGPKAASTQRKSPANAGKTSEGLDDDNDEEEGENEFIQPPQPIQFTTFLQDFIVMGKNGRRRSTREKGADNEVVEDNDDEGATLAATTVVKTTDGKQALTRVYLREVLPTGRPIPVGTLSSVNLAYGPIVVEESVCYTVAQEIAESGTTLAAEQQPKASTSGVPPASLPPLFSYVEADQALLNDLVQWNMFFSTFFDPTTVGMCRDPVSLIVAILLACGMTGRTELLNTVEARATQTVSRLCASDKTSTHTHTCTACRDLQLEMRQQWHWQALMASRAEAAAQVGVSSRGSTTKCPIRFFLTTPAVALWLIVFLQLNRVMQTISAAAAARAAAAAAPDGMSAPVSNNKVIAGRGQTTFHSGDEGAGSGAPLPGSGDVLRPGEVYFIRDWIAQQAALDAPCLEDQASDGSLCIPLTCATHGPVIKVGFSTSGMARTVERLTLWVDTCVQMGAPLNVHKLIAILREELPTTAYYMSFFSPMTVAQTTQRQEERSELRRTARSKR